MDPIQITAEQLKKLAEMADILFPENQWVKVSHTGYVNGGRIFNIQWFEFCMFFLLPKVAEEHGKQPYTTPSWSVYMVKQKIINELGTTNPIDTLYDIWKHPDKYAQTL